MMNYEDYFSSKAILKILCKYRIKQAKKKHKYHLLRDVSLHKISILFLKSKHNCPPDLKELFPSRRTWHRANKNEREKFNNSQEITIYSLYKTITSVHYKVINKIIEPPIWYNKLQKLIERVQNRALNPLMQQIDKPAIFPIKKEDNKQSKICRPISLYNLEDGIIIGFTSKYLTDLFDPYLHDCSYAFRSAKLDVVRTHHDVIERIRNYKTERLGKKIFVSECDLEKFFDCVNHEIIQECFEKFIQKVIDNGGTFEDKAKEVFLQYLNSYKFNKSVYKLNGTEYFNDFKIPDGEFDWPLDVLKGYYGDSITEENIGVPQGGAISCLIANLLLHEVDEAVTCESNDNELLYLRFCDDMVILHSDEEKCFDALHRYLTKIKALKLVVHEPQNIIEYGKPFWKTKSKSPYLWAVKNTATSNVPWLGFVGYQVRFDGIIRVRKKSILKETTKQKNEMKDVLQALNHSHYTKHKINEHSRKSRRQQIHALENRLISMSVGRSSLHTYGILENGLCWTNGFKKLNTNSVSRTQLKYLDRRRMYVLRVFKKKLSGLIKRSENPDILEKKTFFGHPFSYHGFLRK